MNILKKAIIQSHMFNLIVERRYQKRKLGELYDMCRPVIDKYQGELKEPIGNCSEYIWVCWWQGETSIHSPIVKECYRRICEFNTDKKVILITDKNMTEYVKIPDFILEKYSKGSITKTHLSDILRCKLLKVWGGVWMDVTLYTFERVPLNYYTYPIYTGRMAFNKYDYNVSRNRWSSYFWVSRFPDNVLFQYLSDVLDCYWRSNDEMINYFLIDFMLALGYYNIPAIRKEIDMVPENSCGKNVWQLLNSLSLSYDESELMKIRNENWMQKLTYKGEDSILSKSENPENCFYSRLFLS